MLAGRVVDGNSTDWAVVFVIHGDFFGGLVVESVLVHDAIERAQVVVVGVSEGEVCACDVDVVLFLGYSVVHCTVSCLLVLSC